MTSTAIKPGTSSSSAFDPGNVIEPFDGSFTIFEGRPHPVGPTVIRDQDHAGVNFSVYSENATSIELLLFAKPSDLDPCKIYKLNSIDHKSFHFWHVFVEGVKPGMGYAFRVDGPQNHRDGHRFDPSKVLIDPYAKGNNTSLWRRGDACQFGFDNLHTSMRSVVIDVDDYDWENDRPLRRPMSETIIYEMHVGGFTKSPTSGVSSPGTFSGVIEKIPYLQSLGITAVELLPIFSASTMEVGVAEARADLGPESGVSGLPRTMSGLTCWTISGISMSMKWLNDST
jgi:glycogen operon protein